MAREFYGRVFRKDSPANDNTLPIHPDLPCVIFSQEEFDSLDRVVMQHAYAARNKPGRLLDGRAYENERARTSREAGHEDHTRVPVKVSHGFFEKTYFTDLIIDQMLYKLMTVTSLAAEHEAQALRYAMLLNGRRDKLLNFRPERLQGKLCFNPLDDAARRKPHFVTADWRPNGGACGRLLKLLRDIIADWGTHLRSRLYAEALIQFHGAEAHCLQPVLVGKLGTHLVQSHAMGMAFVLNSLTRGIQGHRHHLTRPVSPLEITALHWFNLNQSTIEC